MTSKNLVCTVCDTKATKAQLLDGTHRSKSLCDLNREVYDLRNRVVTTEGVRDRLYGDVQALISYGLEEDVVPDKEWLRYARRFLKARLSELNSQVGDLQKVKDGIIMHRVRNGLPVSTRQERSKYAISS